MMKGSASNCSETIAHLDIKFVRSKKFFKYHHKESTFID